MIKVVYNNVPYDIEREMTVYEFLKDTVKENMSDILACKVFYEVKNVLLVKSMAFNSRKSKF